VAGQAGPDDKEAEAARDKVAVAAQDHDAVAAWDKEKAVSPIGDE
jgi:hypothetical protein